MTSPDDQLRDRMREAFARFNAGDLAGAERLCSDVLDEAPRNADALHLLGVMLLVGGDAAGAVALLAEAVGCRPGNPLALEDLGLARLALNDYPAAESAFRQALAHGSVRASLHMRLGMTLISLGRPEEAIAELSAAAAKAPADAEIHLNLGIAQISHGRQAEAAESFRRAATLEPGNPGAHLNLGNALAEQGRAEEALNSYRRALELQPGNAAAHFNIATQMRRAGRLDVAEKALQSALAAAPGHADAHNDLGVIYQQQERIEDAASCFRRAIALDPNHFQAHNNLGNVARVQGRLGEAIALYEKALELAPGHAQAYANLGDARTDEGRYAEAQALFEKALSLDPANAQARNDLGIVLSAQHLWDQAITQYQRVLQLEPTLTDTQYNLGLARLFCHEFETGWPGYEQRLQCAQIRRGIRDANTLDLYEHLPRWRGPAEPEAGEVAIWNEQGIGDQVLFSTLIPELMATGVPFLFEVDARLLKAYERAFPGVRFVALEKPPRQELQQAGCVMLAGSLPGLFRMSRESFARQPQKLLRALPQRVAYYCDRLAALGPGPKVAFSWKSKHMTVRLGPDKSPPLMTFAPLLKQAGAHFVDVQYGDTAAERAAVEQAEGARLLHFDEVDYYHDLEELLAILEACDLLITTSNATAHFAGALGKRTWLLYLADRAPFYYWAHRGSHRSLWYPSVEIVTGRHLTEWAPLIARAADKLARQS